MGEGSEPGPEPARAVPRTEELIAAMSDPSNSDMVESLFAAAGVDPDFDLSAPGALEEIVERFNRLSPDAFGEATGALPSAEPFVVGPVRLPAVDELRASAAAAPVLEKFRLLHEASAQPGLRLTSSGNLNLADARRLVELLDTGDEPDETLGDHTYKLRSAAHLRGLTRWIAWALTAGVVRRYRGRLVAVAAWSKKARDPVATLERAVEALQLIGPVSIDVYWEPYVPLAMFIEDGVGRLLGELLDIGEPIEIQQLCTLMTETAHFAQRVVPLLPEGRLAEVTNVPELVDGHTRDLLDRLAECGLVRLDGVTLAERAYGRHRRVGGTIELTPAGVPVAVRLASQLGIQVIERADPATATAAQIVDLVGEIDEEQWRADVAIWASGRPVAEAADELLHALADPPDRPEYTVLTGFESLHGVLGTAVEPAIRSLLDGPRDALALLWLSQHGDIDPSTVAPERMLTGGVALFAAMLDLDGPEGLLRSLSSENDPRVELDLVSDLWRSNHPRTFEVLTVVGDNHPDKAVAKAARKSAFKSRSRTGQRQ